MHDLRTGTPRRSVDLTVLSGAAKQKMEEKAKVQRAIATLAVRSGKVELACDLLELSERPAPTRRRCDVIAEIAAEHGVPTGKNEAVVVWRVRAAQYIVSAVAGGARRAHAAAQARGREEDRVAAVLPKRTSLDARGAHCAGDCQAGAAVRRRDARRGEDLLQGRAGARVGCAGSDAKITEVLEQQQRGRMRREWTPTPSADADRYVCVTNASKRARVTKNRCYHLSDSGIGMVMREAAAKGCFVLIDAIVGGRLPLRLGRECAHARPLRGGGGAGGDGRPPNLEGDRAGGGPQGRPVRQEHVEHDLVPDGDPQPPHALLAHDRPRRAGPRGDAAHQEARQRRDHGFEAGARQAKAKAEHNAAGDGSRRSTS